MWDINYVNDLGAMLGAIPLFVQQILYYCLENNLLHNENGLWDLDTISFAIPASIQPVLISLIDRLDQDVQLIVQATAMRRDGSSPHGGSYQYNINNRMYG